MVNNIVIKNNRTLISIIKIYTDSFEAIIIKSNLLRIITTNSRFNMGYTLAFNVYIDCIEAINKNINASSISTTSVYIYLNFFKPCLTNSIHITIKNAASSENIATSSHMKKSIIIEYLQYNEHNQQ